MKALILIVTAACTAYGASMTTASAQPHARTHSYYPQESYAPESDLRVYAPQNDDRYVLPEPPPVGFVFARHAARCEYPTGWSVTDFGRNLNGIPRSGHELLATGCGIYDPLAD